MLADGRWDLIRCLKGCMKNQQIHHVTRHNTPIHNILSIVPQLSISQMALETLPEDGNVTSKHVGATIHNQQTECLIVAFVGFSCIYLLRYVFISLSALKS